MRSLHLRSCLLTSCAIGVLAIVGCGQGNTVYLPTAPTGTLGSNALSTDEAADSGLTTSKVTDDIAVALDKGNKDKDNAKDDKDKDKKDNGKGGGGDSSESDDDAPVDDGPGRGLSDKVVGFVTATSTDSLTVRGMTVKATVATRIHHGNRVLNFGQIHVGDHIQAYGSMTGTALVATEIKVEDTGNDNNDDASTAQGVISGFNPAECPVVTFMVGISQVTTSASTSFQNVTCATLVNGMTVAVIGASQADGSIMATTVERQKDKVEGTVSGLTGSCAAGLTFMVGTTKVTTSTTTTFAGVTCAALANGTMVEVVGTMLADLSIAAESVALQ
jgi:hypothetical protein